MVKEGSFFYLSGHTSVSEVYAISKLVLLLRTDIS
jgi:hypothetical protein